MIVAVADPTQVAVARRVASELAGSHGFDESNVGRVALITTEIVTNLLKHATRGELVIGRYDDGSGAGIELIGLDKGEGIANVVRSLEDGYSTAGSPGTGLGAIQRQADQFEIFSRLGHGTAILARVADKPHDAASPLVGAVVTPYPGETACGDAWAFGVINDKPTLLMVDGSGHGALAEAAAAVGVQCFRERLSENVTRLMEDIHRALSPTRGAAVAVAQIDHSQQLVRYVGVGNIAGAVLSGGEVRRMVSHNGTAGHIAPRIREFTYPISGTASVLLHSDGLSNRWDMAHYPGLAASHPSLVAGVLYRDHRRGRDDAAVVVMRV
jgi:anti-sigma regulatory factor (Ser/Thr protein kinase)